MLLGSFNAVESDASERVGEPTGAVVTRLRETTRRYDGSNVTVLASRDADTAGGAMGGSGLAEQVRPARLVAIRQARMTGGT